MSRRPKRKLRIIVLMHEDLIPPENLNGVENKEKEEWRAENDVVTTLPPLGHESLAVGGRSEGGVIRPGLEEEQTHVGLHLLREFDSCPPFATHHVSDP